MLRSFANRLTRFVVNLRWGWSDIFIGITPYIHPLSPARQIPFSHLDLIRRPLLQLSSSLGRAIPLAVSRWLPTATARVRAWVWPSGICGGQSGAGAGFVRALRFPLTVFMPPNSPSSQSPGAGTIGRNWPTSREDPVWTLPPTMRI
jgi:hypothetical protein